MKQKLKMLVSHSLFHNVFENYGGLKKGAVKLKTAFQLNEILNIARHILDNDEDWRDLPDAAVIRRNYEQMRSVLEMRRFQGVNRKVQLKKTKKEQFLQLIIKWGGEITPHGIEHAEKLGKFYQSMYPEDEGLLKLHATLRHDLQAEWAQIKFFVY